MASFKMAFKMNYPGIKAINHLLDNFEHKALEIYNRLLLEESETPQIPLKMKLLVGETGKNYLLIRLQRKWLKCN